MAIKRKKGGGGGGANWMDTYGDMVTLLLCFFVLLYSMSTISEENWRALVMSFNPSAVMELEKTPEGNEGPVADPAEDGIGLEPGLTQTKVDADMEELYMALVAFVSGQGAQSEITVTQGGGRIFISFNNAVFFDGNRSTLRSDAYPILDQVCEMLDGAVDAIDEVRVLGHTAQEVPDRPNNVQTDRTLSSNRATNVIIYVQEHSTVDPARLISEGMGQWRPVASNETSEGRAKNRRVEMIISGRNLAEEMQGDMTIEVGA